MNRGGEQGTIADALQEKIKVLHDSIWERRADWPRVTIWLEQFQDARSTPDERLQALYLLSNFMYFGTSEIRALLRSLFRDIYRPSVIAEIRRGNPTLSMEGVAEAFELELERTRFVSLGNPSESSAFLLYYFRQENKIGRECFISGAEIFTFDKKLAVRDPRVTRYVFIDDMCGSGSQGEEYSENAVLPLKKLKPEIHCYYYALFGAGAGIQRLRNLDRFDSVHAVVDLDESFRCFSPKSRIYAGAPSPLTRDAGMALAERFGARLQPGHPLGFLDGQLLLGFAYNTPDNTLPIIWSDGDEAYPWAPVFKRYSKLTYD